MRFFKMPGPFGTGLLVGVGAATLIPLVARMFAGAGKPLIKEVVKGGLLVMDQGKSLYNETRSSISEVSTEAKADISAAKTKTDTTKTASPKSASSTPKTDTSSS